MTLFEKILAREIPATILYEDAESFAIQDIHPMAPVHLLIIPKKPLPNLSEACEADSVLLGHLLQVARKLAQTHALEDSFRLVINNGLQAGQSVPHLHIHLLSGRMLGWPPG